MHVRIAPGALSGTIRTCMSNWLRTERPGMELCGLFGMDRRSHSSAEAQGLEFLFRNFVFLGLGVTVLQSRCPDLCYQWVITLDNTYHDGMEDGFLDWLTLVKRMESSATQYLKDVKNLSGSDPAALDAQRLAVGDDAGPMGPQCPKCSEFSMAFQEGCATCMSCGYSKCG